MGECGYGQLSQGEEPATHATPTIWAYLIRDVGEGDYGQFSQGEGPATHATHLIRDVGEGDYGQLGQGGGTSYTCHTHHLGLPDQGRG